MRDPSFFNELISDHEDGVLSFLTPQLVESGLSPSLV